MIFRHGPEKTRRQLPLALVTVLLVDVLNYTATQCDDSPSRPPCTLSLVLLAPVLYYFRGTSVHNAQHSSLPAAVL